MAHDGAVTLLVDRFGTSSDGRLLRAVAYPLARAAWDDAYGPAALNQLVLRFIACAGGRPTPTCWPAPPSPCRAFAGREPSTSRPPLAHDDATVPDACCGAVEASDADGGLARLLWAGPAAALRAQAARHRAAVAAAR